MMKTAEQIVKEAQQLAQVFELLGVSQDEVIDSNNDIKLCDFVQSIRDQIGNPEANKGFDEVGYVEELFDEIRGQLRVSAKEILTNMFYEYYLAG